MRCSVVERVGAVRVSLAVALGVVAAGCAAEEVFETQMLVVAETDQCEAARMAGVSVNAYRVVFYDFGGTGGEPGEEVAGNPCLACLEAGLCPIVAETCVCAAARPLATNFINDQLAGVRVPGLDPGATYCVGVRGFDIPEEELPPLEGRRECPCDMPPDPRHGRLCGISIRPASVDENSPAIIIGAECRVLCPLP